MKILKLKLILLTSVFFLWGCSGNNNTANPGATGTPTAAATQAAPTAKNHLKIVPFKVTLANDAGTVAEMVATEDGEVIVTNKESGDESVAGTFGNGTLQLEDLGIAVKLNEDGSMTVDDKPSMMSISGEGVLSMDGKEVLKREGDKIVETDASVGVLKKDGKALTATVEGDASGNRFIMLALGSFMFVAVESGEPTPAPAPEGTETPAPEGSATPAE